MSQFLIFSIGYQFQHCCWLLCSGESLHLELHQIVGDLCICGVCMDV
ncbi:hypothetical protein Patl1_26299 [Pistacia atlantica]|uniref:Uncharacterized protein n=1 Tax=Pistacia atlantica TaxID=434234 RepID=A0ACC1B3W1_9ROSI|nr:hypothetical protein Patl1_26299 [Pistacia atlantica]